jgi:hypothetical protein
MEERDVTNATVNVDTIDAEIVQVFQKYAKSKYAGRGPSAGSLKENPQR